MTLNGFDEIFSPYYVEDYDLSLRAWRLGWKCYYEHSSVCRHKTSFSIKRNNRKRDIRIIYNRNKMFLHAIHLDGLSRLLWYLQLIPETVLRIITFKFSYIKSLQLFIKSKKRITHSRNNFKKLKNHLKSDASVKNVVQLVIASLDSEKITRF